MGGCRFFQHPAIEFEPGQLAVDERLGRSRPAAARPSSAGTRVTVHRLRFHPPAPPGAAAPPSCSGAPQACEMTWRGRAGQPPHAPFSYIFVTELLQKKKKKKKKKNSPIERAAAGRDGPPGVLCPRALTGRDLGQGVGIDPVLLDQHARRQGSASSSGSTGTRAWATIGPESSSAVTKCTVQPCSQARGQRSVVGVQARRPAAARDEC